MRIGFVSLPDNTCLPLASLDELATFWPREDVRLWVDLESPTDEELQRLGRIAGLDEEALDDCLRGEQQPRRGRIQKPYLPGALRFARSQGTGRS